MIVVDTNILAYLLLPGDKTVLAEKALQQDNAWAAPLLWRSEFQNVLTGYMRVYGLSLSDGLAVFAKAEGIIEHREFSSVPERVLRLAASSPCSAYDCEYAALAEDIRSPLVTADKRLLQSFPRIAVSLETFTNA